MLGFTKRKGDCTGCTACLAVCPLHCISMHKDEEGFLYPVSSDACIDCGRCQKVCPIENNDSFKNEKTYQQTTYCAVSKDFKIWQRSASGGAFSEICRAFGDDKTIVCGAAWNGLDVHHTCIEGVDNITPLCRSKYVASSLENVFTEIKKYLKEGRKVVFCGTPCQVAGLNNALVKSYDNLLTIDLICHGVGSPKVFKTCMEIIGEQFGKTVIGYEFRAKGKTYTADHLQRINMDKHTSVMLSTDPYIQLFLSQNCLRSSCGGNCRFRNEMRQGDITIADFKGLLKVFPQLYGTKRNYSSIVINTSKGADVMKRMSRTMKILSCNVEDIKEYNPLFFRQTWESKERDAFFTEFGKEPNETVKKYSSPAKLYTESYKRKLWNFFPVFIRRIVLNIIKLNRVGGGR